MLAWSLQTRCLSSLNWSQPHPRELKLGRRSPCDGRTRRPPKHTKAEIKQEETNTCNWEEARQLHTMQRDRWADVQRISTGKKAQEPKKHRNAVRTAEVKLLRTTKGCVRRIWLSGYRLWNAFGPTQQTWDIRRYFSQQKGWLWINLTRAYQGNIGGMQCISTAIEVLVGGWLVSCRIAVRFVCRASAASSTGCLHEVSRVCLICPFQSKGQNYSPLPLSMFLLKPFIMQLHLRRGFSLYTLAYTAMTCARKTNCWKSDFQDLLKLIFWRMMILKRKMTRTTTSYRG